MSLICGVLSPDHPELASAEAIEEMLQAAPHHARNGVRRFLAPQEGVAFGCAYTATFPGARNQVEAPWHESNRLVSATVGYLNETSAGNRNHLEDNINDNVARLVGAYLRRPGSFDESLDGDFAAFVWDRESRLLHLVADCFAKKPLYYYAPTGANFVVFSSELKSVLAHPAVERVLDRRTVSLFLGLGYTPAPFTLAENVRKLQAGEHLTFGPEGSNRSRYWRPEPIPEDVPLEFPVWTDLIEREYLAAVRRLTQGTARVGVYLSGGTDSSVLLAAINQVQEIEPVPLTLAYTTDGSTEDLEWAARVAGNLSRKHHAVLIDPDSEITPGLTRALLRQIDEPFDTSGRIFSEYFLAQAARAAGLDSFLFAGGLDIFSRGRWLRFERGGGGSATIEEAVAYFTEHLIDFDMDRQRGLLTWEPAGDLFRRATLYDLEVIDELPNLRQAITLARIFREAQGRPSLFTTLIPPLYGLEGRTPYFDRGLVQLALSVPTELFGSGRRNKQVLTSCFANDLGVNFTEREKRGYPTPPFPDWLRSAMIEGVESLVDKGLIRGSYLPGLRKHHAQGRRRARIDAWQLFTLNCWHEFHILQRDPLVGY